MRTPIVLFEKNSHGMGRGDGGELSGVQDTSEHCQGKGHDTVDVKL
jgi:hypothetical protein